MQNPTNPNSQYTSENDTGKACTENV